MIILFGTIKRLFNEHGRLILQNLHRNDTFMKSYDILKFFATISIHRRLRLVPRCDKLSLIFPQVKLDVTKLCRSSNQKSVIISDHSDEIVNKIIPSNTGIFVPGNSESLSQSALKISFSFHQNC